MPCSDSSSSLAFIIDHDDRFISFDFAKITCGREITAETGFSRYCVGRELKAILQTSYNNIVAELKTEGEEAQFILYLEWETLRCAIAQYLGIDNVEYDKDRCQITSIEHTEKEIEVAMVILPPKELPKILPCSLGDKKT